MISNFPEFTKLELHHKAAVEAITKKFEPYSDFNFTSMFCWDVDGTTAVSLLHGNLVVRMPDYVTGEPTFSILGNHRMDESMTELFKWTDHLSFVPELSVQALQQPHLFHSEEDRDHHDYVYEVAKVAALPGGDYKKIRNKLNSFVAADVPDVSVRTISYADPAEQQALLQLFDVWAEHSRQSNEDLAAERVAIRNLLEHAETLDVLFTIVKAGPHYIAFSANELLDDGYAICHFEKAISVAHHNTFAFITNQAALALVERGAKLVNWEQDLGLEGTRASKTAYRPARFLPKYEVTLNPS
jgi:hypothetical protein